jgi:hypothetical protein
VTAFAVTVFLSICTHLAFPADAATVAPTITGTPRTSISVGSVYRFQPVATVAPGKTPRFSIANKPGWASFSTTTGLLEGTPKYVNTHTGIKISVSDGKRSAALPLFSIKVVAVDKPPTIGGTPPTTATVDMSYSFTPQASDPEGRTLTFSITGKPAWATFNTGSGRLAGTPPSSAAGTSTSVVISVTDGQSKVSLPTFTLAVVKANRAPVISGTPVTSATVGKPYSFKPTVSDADGDILTFSIANKPSWATFDATTGVLYGTPVSASVGNCSNVTISVSDGKIKSTLAPFSISVQFDPSGGGTATLHWTPPTSNTDGTPITNLAGYRISYGTGSGSYTVTVGVSGAAVTSAVIEGLTAGTWYFAVKALTTTGVVSDFSSEVSKTL